MNKKSLLALSIVLLAFPAFGAEIVWEEGIEYSNPDGQHLKLNMARPKDATGPLPAVVCIHGGGFRAGSRDGYNDLCKRLAERGYVAVTVSYRLSPKYVFPAAVHDVKAAVRFLRANAGKYAIDPDRIASLGGSAGANLAMMLGVTGDVKELEGEGGNPEQSSRVACVVEYFGPTNFLESYAKSVDAKDVLPLYFGGDLKDKRRENILGSPLYWVTPLSAPTLIIHGTADEYVAFEQGQWLFDRMTAAGVEVELLKMEGARHGFKPDEAAKADEAAFAFLDKHLK